jgi:DNA-directed RNA polymerase subunit RPC12/RpoP
MVARDNRHGIFEPPTTDHQPPATRGETVMGSRTTYDDEWEDEDDDWSPDEEESDGPDDEDELPTIPCPYCGKEVLEESIRCPYCGEYRSEEDSPSEPKPTWVIVGLVLAFLAVFFWLVSG